jgi:hypothetical protein
VCVLAHTEISFVTIAEARFENGTNDISLRTPPAAAITVSEISVSSVVKKKFRVFSSRS